MCILTNAIGLFNDILEPDGALYASISKLIVQKNDWVNLYALGGDWLDKPHFPFWMSAISFKIFGINALAYKLPSFIFFVVGIYYTYRLATKVYTQEIAQLATIIYTLALHIILCNFDVRAEIYLTTFIVASIYHLIIAAEKKWLLHILLAATYTACGIMTKGIFVFITVGSGFVIYWLLSKQYKQFINIKWYLYVVFSLIFITPELYCLYHQFDLHPEKMVFGKTNVSGLKFFFWDSQFGRFFNTGPIQGSGDVFFFLHTILWAFLPWSIYLVLGVYTTIRKIGSLVPNNKTILFGCALFSFLLFSLSKFQLPHYIVIIFPLLSIFVADYLQNNSTHKNVKWFSYVQTFIFSILAVFISLITVFYKLNNYIVVIALVVIFSYLCFVFFSKKILFNVIAKAMCFSVLLSVFLNLFFYPSLMQYQAGMMAGKWQQKHYPKSTIPMYKCYVYSFQFYGNSSLIGENNLTDYFKNSKESKLLFANQSDVFSINKDSFNVNIKQSFPYFHITELNFEFINNQTRYKAIDSFAIFEAKPNY